MLYALCESERNIFGGKAGRGRRSVRSFTIKGLRRQSFLQAERQEGSRVLTLQTLFRPAISSTLCTVSQLLLILCLCCESFPPDDLQRSLGVFTGYKLETFPPLPELYTMSPRQMQTASDVSLFAPLFLNKQSAPNFIGGFEDNHPVVTQHKSPEEAIFHFVFMVGLLW